MNLKNKKILVTGSSRGIGQAIAVELAKEGAEICILYNTNLDGANATLEEVSKYSKGYVFRADLEREVDVKELFNEIHSKIGTLDVLVNNAGSGREGDIFNNEILQKQIENIFFTAVYCTQNFLKQNKDSELRKILNITSMMAYAKASDPAWFGYSVAKSALEAMTHTLAKMDPKVLVNAIAPGYTLTPAWGEMSDADKKPYEKETIIGRFINPEEISQMAVAILKNDALTGQTVVIDGGVLAK